MVLMLLLQLLLLMSLLLDCMDEIEQQRGCKLVVFRLPRSAR